MQQATSMMEANKTVNDEVLYDRLIAYCCVSRASVFCGYELSVLKKYLLVLDLEARSTALIRHRYEYCNRKGVPRTMADHDDGGDA